MYTGYKIAIICDFFYILLYDLCSEHVLLQKIFEKHLFLPNRRYLQSDSTQTINHIQKCFRQKFQCSRRPSYWTTLFFIGGGAEAMLRSTPLFKMEPSIFFLLKLLPILRRIQRPTTQGHSSHAKYENSRKIIFISFQFLRYP